jgi:hypothetical protein
MPKEIFDQDRPRSAKAQRLDEAFAGCDEWTLAPPSPRRVDLDIAPWLSSRSRPIDRAAAARRPESRAA